MRDLKTYLSVAPVLSTLWFGSLAGLLIEINRFFPDALTFPFFLIRVIVAGRGEKD
uniref:Photosystem I reaction center subunit IX n=1 Tax=Gossypium barbadense TaxID=3634 RepID=PSAJ_GOSBA|nr:PSI J-protein [Gossypium barbadense]A0ZZ55.1 RecName: Full=Photosystem I reaction center subunit IX; AltName: Full=PSI-J [Gossypium barbadense]BAF41267.1 PSI J-protein [Gossypium barbadense]